MPPIPHFSAFRQKWKRFYQKGVEGSAGDIPVDQLNPEQLRRYKAWKRSRLERGPIREVSVKLKKKKRAQRVSIVCTHVSYLVRPTTLAVCLASLHIDIFVLLVLVLPKATKDTESRL